MSSFVSFEGNFKFINIKTFFFLYSELLDILTQEWKNSNSYSASMWATHASSSGSQFIEKVVSSVKKTHFTTSEETCVVSLDTLLPPPPDSCPSPQINHLTIIAQMLYRSYGIEIQKIDDLQAPRNMIVSWHRDHPYLNPSSSYLIKSRKEGFRTDCTLKFGEKLYPVHGTVLAAKSPYFEKMFKSQCKEAEFGAIIPIIMEEVEDKSVEMLLDYFYTGELDLKEASLAQIDNLVNLSSYFALLHLEQICFEHLCRNVNADNLKGSIALARHYGHVELETALIQHIEKEINIENFEKLLQLAKAESIKGLEERCITGFSELLRKIDYEPSGFGKSTQIQHFSRLLDVMIKTPSARVLTALMTKMQKILSHPGYGTHLEKLIEYFDLICDYEPRFNEESLGHIHEMKSELYQDVLKSIRLRGKDLYKEHLTLELIEKCFEVAEKYQIEDIKSTWNQVLIKKIEKGLENSEILKIVEMCLKISEKYSLPDLRKACETLLIIKISALSHQAIHLTERDNQILNLANQLKLTPVKEECEEINPKKD